MVTLSKVCSTRAIKIIIKPKEHYSEKRAMNTTKCIDLTNEGVGESVLTGFRIEEIQGDLFSQSSSTASPLLIASRKT